MFKEIMVKEIDSKLPMHGVLLVVLDGKIIYSSESIGNSVKYDKKVEEIVSL